MARKTRRETIEVIPEHGGWVIIRTLGTGMNAVRWTLSGTGGWHWSNYPNPSWGNGKFQTEKEARAWLDTNPLPETLRSAKEARKTSRKPSKPSAHAAGADYAREQLAGAYFQDWVWEQMAEAERMRAADPSSVLPLETPADARKVARNMLKQLGWDTKRELKESKEFFEGFDEVLRAPETLGWLAETILDFNREARETKVREAYGRRGRHGGDDRHKQYEEEWQRQRAEYQAKVEPLKAGLIRIVGGDELLRRGMQIPTNGTVVASLSDPRRGNEPVAHFRRYPGFGYGEDGGIGQTYFVDPAIVPAGRETRTTINRSPPTVTSERRSYRRPIAPYYSRR